MGMKRFELVEGSARKFWEVGIDGKALVVTFGRIGSAGQTKKKPFPDAAAARREADKLVAEKTKKGYAPAKAGTPAKPSKAAKPGPVSATAKPRTSAEWFKRIEPALRKSVMPYVRIVAKPTRKPVPLWASKASDGRPYLPRDLPWPMRGTIPLLPVLQIDLSEVPALPGFPRKGLLSLFWSEDHQATKLYYFPTILRDDAKLHGDFEAFAGHALYPYRTPMALTFERREGCVSRRDHRCAEIVGGTDVLDEISDSGHDREIWKRIRDWSGGSDTRLGGYASPQQGDPRERKPLAKFATQLLQIQNDNFTHNFFIEPAKLARADFSAVHYYNACD